VSVARQRRKIVSGDRMRPEEISARERTRKTRNETSAAAPGQSIEKSFAGPPSGGEKQRKRMMLATPIGTLIRKMYSHPRDAVTIPPRTGAAIAATAVVVPM